MVNGVHGEITPLVLKAAELDTKQEHVPATNLLHLEEERHAPDYHQNQENVTLKIVQVRNPSFSFDHFQNIYQYIMFNPQ